VLCDTREQRSGIPDLLLKQRCAVDVVQLDCGDYQLSATLAVERKSPRDLVDSLVSERLYHQLERLNDTFECTALLIEGDSWSGDLRLKTPMLARLYDWISFRPRINVLYSPDEKWTARLLTELARREQTSPAPSPTPSRASRKAARSPRDVLLALPGVGPANAQRLLDRFGTLTSVVAATEEELIQIVGATRGAQLHALLSKAE